MTILRIILIDPDLYQVARGPTFYLPRPPSTFSLSPLAYYKHWKQECLGDVSGQEGDKELWVIDSAGEGRQARGELQDEVRQGAQVKGEEAVLHRM